MSELMKRLVSQLMDRHLLPWRIEYDWTVEVVDAAGHNVIKLMKNAEAFELIALANEIDVENKLGDAQMAAILAEAGIDD